MGKCLFSQLYCWVIVEFILKSYLCIFKIKYYNSGKYKVYFRYGRSSFFVG